VVDVTVVQERVVAALSLLAMTWLAERLEPDGEAEIFPNEMVWHSLTPMLESFAAESLWQLIDSEQVRGCRGPAVIGHIIASNTPLLPITSVVRALLVGGSSIVKLPSQTSNGWFTLFCAYLNRVDPEIARAVRSERWPRSDAAKNSWFYESVNLVIAYGDDQSLVEIKRAALAPVVAYGHRISAAVITSDADESNAYDGLASDILMYDQGGCLSPHTVFVEGNLDRARHAAVQLSAALKKSSLPLVNNTSERMAKVREYRSLISMDASALIIDQQTTQYTVVLHESEHLHVSPAHCIVYVVPGSKEGIIEEITNAKLLIQGIALASENIHSRDEWKRCFLSAGIEHVCRFGILQQPTIHWRENNQDVLSCLIL